MKHDLIKAQNADGLLREVLKFKFSKQNTGQMS